MSAHCLRYIFQAVGTLGDVLPLVAIGREMIKHGHDVHVLANAAHRSLVEDAQMKFFSIATQEEVFRGTERENPENFVFTCLDAVTEYFQTRWEASQPSVVVNTGRDASSNLWSERHDLPTVRLYLTPKKIRSNHAPCLPLGAPMQGCFPHTFRTYALPRVRARQDRDPRVLATVNRRRAIANLPPVETCFYDEPYVDRHVALFPDWFGAPAPDWPTGVRCVGFPFATSDEELPDALHTLVEREGRPLVFTPGTAAPRDAEPFARWAEESCEALQRPGILPSPYLAPGRRGRVLFLPYVDLGRLLERAAVLVHHGGIGTTASALRAGVPQVILPGRFDQWDNGGRVERLGVGAALERKGLTGAQLADRIRSLLEDPFVATRLSALRDQARSSRAVDMAAATLEEVAARRWSSTRRQVRPLGSPRRPILFVAYPDAEAWQAPAALARALEARGDRVLVGSPRNFAAHLRSSGFEHVDLTGMSDWGRRWSLFENLPHRVALSEAVERFVATFQGVLERYRPRLVLFDGRYAPLGLVTSHAGVNWAIYEPDLPRELDARVPPPEMMASLDGDTPSPERIRAAWANQLSYVLWLRDRERSADLPYDWTRRYFTSALMREFERRGFGRVTCDRFAAHVEVPLVPRMIFSLPAFDFERGRTAGRGTWVGPCIEERGPEPPFPWDACPPGRQLVYAAIAASSLASPRERNLVHRIVEVIARRNDMFLVLVAPEHAWPPAGTSGLDSVLFVDEAPQPALLRRAELAIVDATFPRVRECASCGVPIVAVAFSAEQRRNAALVNHLGLGVGLDAADEPSIARIDAAVQRASGSRAMKEKCARMRRAFERAGGLEEALAFVDALLVAPPLAAAGRESHRGRRIAP